MLLVSADQIDNARYLYDLEREAFLADEDA